jgi:hypothetical protein
LWANELASENGPKTQDFETLFSALASDEPRALDGVADDANMPVDAEPERVNDDLESTRASYITGSSKP